MPEIEEMLIMEAGGLGDEQLRPLRGEEGRRGKEVVGDIRVVNL